MKIPKYDIGDVVQLLNGKIRLIQMRQVTQYENYTLVEYQGRWYQSVFDEKDIAQKIND